LIESQPFNLGSYLSRVGYTGKAGSDLDVLQALHAAHLATIPFENLDILLDRPIYLDIGSLEKKIVHSRRGGYCFEQNTLFASALRALGFQVSTLEARVRPAGATKILPRTHMVLQVDLGQRKYLADVGFGADGPIHPVPLEGAVSEQAGGAYRVVSEGMVRVLQSRYRDEWRDLYAFTLVPAYPIDFEVANHFTSTHPGSPFLRTLTAQIAGPGARHVLRGRKYCIRRAEGEEIHELSNDQVVQLLKEQFRLPLSEGEITRALLRGE
jgi:N-hydroxyarylamine O-acetyltransferase